MKIKLARIDDRLVHGQVVTMWIRESGCKRIFVCSDEVANDTLRKTFVIQVAPPGIKVNVFTINKVIEIYNNPKYESFNVLMLFTNPLDVLRLVERGVDIKSVNIGGMCFETGKTQITCAVSVDDDDINAFKSLHHRGIELEIRMLPSDKNIYMMKKLLEENLI